MSLPPHLQSLTEQLPFELANVDKANAVFERWATQEKETAKRLVDIWTYCYVVQYFYVKSVHDEIRGASDLDDLVTRAYNRINEKRSGLRDPSRYAHWVSVICKRIFLNHVRTRFDRTSIDAEEGPRLPPVDAAHVTSDLGFTHQLLLDAIDRLPEYLQETARLYFLDEWSFSEVSDKIGKPVPTVRAYKHKVVKRLREDETLRTLMERREM
jgi:RNA polymerase sigma factor (sigma-70 family)